MDTVFNTVRLDVTDAIAVLTLNRPDKLNTVTAEMGRELEEALDFLRNQDEVGVVILTGAGKAFCAGQDVNVFGADPTGTRKDLERLKRPPFIFFEKPVIAAVNGVAAGAGADFVLMCDIIVASDTARFSFPGARLGIACPYALIRLAEEIGRAKAKELLMTGDWISAEEALNLHLINRVVPAAQLMETAFEMALKIKKSAPLSVKAVKESINRTLSGFEYSYEVMVDLTKTEDSIEGKRAFLEKRDSVFKGR
ncbi:MAG: hypothetical protein C0392_07545 [Syntrophus sp. (in: bacteria)]|nr:hypothetical protein [Syntrophus sp. (in: bacteria)]